jgi:ubiquinone biosynthesis protein UbiJ
LIAEALFERSLNHLLRQTPGAAEALLRHAGCNVRFDLTLAQFDFRIGDDGYFSEAAVDVPDAVIRPTAALLTRLPFFGRGSPPTTRQRPSANARRVFKQLDWDVEADLAIVGDVPHRLRTLGLTPPASPVPSRWGIAPANTWSRKPN